MRNPTVDLIDQSVWERGVPYGVFAELRRSDPVRWHEQPDGPDESVFVEPDRFDVRRSPNEHLSFGHAEHFCLGASLARLELRVMFEELLQGVGEIVPLAPPRRLRSNLINGIKEMRVELRPREWTRETRDEGAR